MASLLLLHSAQHLPRHHETHATYTRVLHSELLTELSSRFSSFRESRRVRKARTLPKYFRNSSSNSFRLVPTLIFANFREFFAKIGSERVFASREGSDITEIFPKFEKVNFRTRPDSFRLETRLESSVKSSECRAQHKST